jgi:tRNA/tmRNA/rRNA uracil-C5-methylase (TrmA/RlmC/RlmD family)
MPAGRADDIETGAVVALTHEGDGIVRAGKAVFVAGALPGELIRFRRSVRHRQHDDGRLLEVLQSSAARVPPACAHFGICGGCALQHLAPSAQLAAKEAELRDNLERMAHVTPRTWLPALAGPAWGYRRRARLSAKFVAKKGRVLVGFRERYKPYVSAIATCEVLAPAAAALIEPLSAALTKLSIRDRVAQIEVSIADNAIALVLRVLAEPDGADLGVLRGFEAQHSVRLYLQRGGLDSVRRLTEVPFEEALRYALPAFALELEFAPTDFIRSIGKSMRPSLGARSNSSSWMPTPGCSTCTVASAISPWRWHGARTPQWASRWMHAWSQRHATTPRVMDSAMPTFTAWISPSRPPRRHSVCARPIRTS